MLSQNINVGYSITVGLKISFLPNDKLILACALDTSKIQIYVPNNTAESGTDFHCGAQLIGHEDWVRGLDFTSDGKRETTHIIQQNKNTTQESLKKLSIH